MIRPRGGQVRALADEELMGLVRDGEPRAFEVLFDRHGDAAFSLAYRMCGRQAMAEDVVQEAFLSLWRSGAHYDRARGSVRSWVLSVVHNRAVDAFRRGAVKDSRDVHDDGITELLAAPDRTDREAERLDDARQVRAALGDLPTDQRRVIELAYFGGFSHREIAEMLDLPTGTVKGRMRLGLTKMRLAFGDPTGSPALHTTTQCQTSASAATTRPRTRSARWNGTRPRRFEGTWPAVPSAAMRSPCSSRWPARCRWPPRRSSRRGD
jgi:RNA polymerase sigma-70 factor (ECF subfamily)